MRKKYIDQKEVRNIDDIDLNNTFHLRKMFEEWETLHSLSEHHLKVKDLFIEIEERWIESNLSPSQRDAIRMYLMEGGYTEREVGEEMGVGARTVNKLVKEGLEVIATYR